MASHEGEDDEMVARLRVEQSPNIGHHRDSPRLDVRLHGSLACIGEQAKEKEEAQDSTSSGPAFFPWCSTRLDGGYYVEGHNFLGIAYVRLGLPGQARPQFERVLELDPSSARALNNLGLMAILRRDFPEAVRLLSEAVRYNPGNVRAHNGLGIAHAETGNGEAAIESWKRVVELDPGRFDSLYNLALAMANHAPEEALPYLERFVREAPPEQYRESIAEARDLIRQIQTTVR